MTRTQSDLSWKRYDPYKIWQTSKRFYLAYKNIFNHVLVKTNIQNISFWRCLRFFFWYKLKLVLVQIHVHIYIYASWHTGRQRRVKQCNMTFSHWNGSHKRGTDWFCFKFVKFRLYLTMHRTLAFSIYFC